MGDYTTGVQAQGLRGIGDLKNIATKQNAHFELEKLGIRHKQHQTRILNAIEVSAKWWEVLDKGHQMGASSSERKEADSDEGFKQPDWNNSTRPPSPPKYKTLPTTERHLLAETKENDPEGSMVPKLPREEVSNSLAKSSSTRLPVPKLALSSPRPGSQYFKASPTHAPE